MSTRRVVPASAAPTAPRFLVESPWPGVGLGLAAGDDVDMRTKRAPNEDSLGAALLGEAIAVAVADAHFGPASSELAIDLLFRRLRTAPADRGALLEVVEGVAEAVERDELTVGQSETTLCVAVVTGRRVDWVSVGDSVPCVVAADGALRVLSRPAPVFIGRPGTAAALPHDAGTLELAPGEWLVLATDGVEPDCSGLTAPELGRLLRRGPDVTAGLRAVLEIAGAYEAGGGGDNVALAVVDPDQLSGSMQ